MKTSEFVKRVQNGWEPSQAPFGLDKWREVDGEPRWPHNSRKDLPFEGVIGSTYQDGNSWYVVTSPSGRFRREIPEGFLEDPREVFFGNGEGYALPYDKII